MCTAGQRVLLTITGPGPSFLKYKNLGRASDPKGTMSYRTEGEFPSVHGGQGLSKGRRAGGLGLRRKLKEDAQRKMQTETKRVFSASYLALTSLFNIMCARMSIANLIFPQPILSQRNLLKFHV